MSNWVFVKDASLTWKGHVIPADMVEGLKQDFARRHPESGDSFEVEPISETGWDLPGMIWLGRTYRSVDVDGLKFEVPSQDWAECIWELRLRKERVFPNGGRYYKLHHRWFCIVFTSEQHAKLVAAMEAQLAEANKEADHDNAEFVRRIDEINRDGVKVISARAIALKNPAKPEDLN